jgi:hypothetical protein
MNTAVELFMSDLLKAVVFGGASMLSFGAGLVIDQRQLRANPESSFAVPFTFITNSIICAGVAILLFGDYLLHA